MQTNQLWENSQSWGRIAPGVQKVTSLLADGLCPRADRKLNSGGLGATIKTNTQTRAHIHITKFTSTESKNEFKTTI